MTLSTTLPSAFTQEAKNWVIFICHWPISNLHLFHLSARCLPFYIFLIIFRVTSFSLVLVVLGGFYSIVLYFVLLSILLSGIFLSMLLDGENVAVLENLSRIRQQQGLVYLFMLPFRTVLSTGTSAFLISLHLITGDTDKETIFQVFWFLCNSLLVVSLNFVVNLKLSGQFPNIESIYNFLSLNEVHVIKHDLAFNAIVGTVILAGNISTSLYFLYIKDWSLKSTTAKEE